MSIQSVSAISSTTYSDAPSDDTIIPGSFTSSVSLGKVNDDAPAVSAMVVGSTVRRMWPMFWTALILRWAI